jgi:hypothetical protein
MMLNFVGAGSPTIIAHNLQSHKPAPAHAIGHDMIL